MNKKFVGIILLFLFIILVCSVFFILKNSKEEKVLELKEMQVEEIKYDKNKVNIYLFYGKGCPHCEELINYLNTLPNPIKNKIELYTFEVWYNEESFQLLMDLGEYMDITPENIPFLLIGDTYFEGFRKSDEEKIKKSIQNFIKNKKRKDIYQEYLADKTE